MDKTTRSELLKTVETQKEHIERYQTKLRDLIAAYKSIVKEKDALEATVKALSAPQVTPLRREKLQKQANKDGKEENPESDFIDPLREVNEDEESATIKQLRQQVMTLTSSMATLSQEKSKMEANYLGEKKKMRQEHQETMEQVMREADRQNRLVSDLQSEVTEWRNQLRSQQRERERERMEHETKIRELQKVVAQEHCSKESLEMQLDETRMELSERAASPDISESYEIRIRGLSDELHAVRDRLKASEASASIPTPLLLRLQEEMAEMKAQNRITLQREQGRAKEAEESMRQIGQHGEERASLLEAKLTELSEVVGNYERLRFQDQTVIQRLRERVTQLDMENTALAKAAHKGSSMDHENDSDDTNLDVQALVDKMTRLKGCLKLANERSEKPVNIEELLQVGDLGSLEVDNRHKRCQEEYDQLKEEFERYKLRAQSVLKNKSSKDTGPKETDLLKAQNSELKERLRHALDENEEAKLEHARASKDLHTTMTAVGEHHQKEVAALSAEHKSKTAELELEIRRHRDRTIALLAEKDKEIEILRAKTPNQYESQYMASIRGMPSQNSDDEDTLTQAPQSLLDSQDSSVVNELIKWTGGATTGDTTILHFSQERARKDVEINMLRKQKHSLESGLRDLQRVCAQKDEVHQERMEILEEQIRRLQRMTSQNDASNLEYLKNVIYQYMVCQDSTGKLAMLNAISTILQFSPREKETVRHFLTGGWWTSGSYKSSRTVPTTKI